MPKFLCFLKRLSGIGGKPFSRAARASSLVGLLVLGCPVDGQIDRPSVDQLKRLSMEELMNIEVTSVSRYPEPLTESASAIQVITQEQIRRSGASSIPEALRLAYNLNIAQKNAHDWGISARGFNTELSNKLLVLMDGRTVYTPLYSGVFWNVQDYLLADLNRIEVISGPGGTLWGANAVNGVINITSKRARDTQGVYLEAGAGTQLEAFTGVRYGGALSPNLHYRVYGTFFERGSERMMSGADARDDWSKLQGGFRLDAEPTADDLLTFQGDLYSGDSGMVGGGGESHFSGGNLLGRWSRTLADGSDLRLQVYFDRTRLRLPVAADSNGLAPAGTLTDDLDTYDIDFQHRWQLLDQHLLVWGFGYRLMRDDAGSAPALGFLPEELQSERSNVFVQDAYSLTENLVLTAGVKLEHNSYTDYEFQPNVRMQWIFAPDHTLWAAVSQAVRTPSRVDRDLVQPPGPIVILQGGRDFQSERVIAYEAGYRARMGNRASGSLSVFFNDYSRLRSVNFTPATIIPLFFDNDLEGETYGLELAVGFAVTDRWRLHGGYNWLKEDIRLAPGGYDLNSALNETADPEHQLSLRSSIDLPGNLELDTGLRWVDSFTINDGGAPATVESYTELDIRLGWRLRDGLDLSIVGQNLLHDSHAEYGAPGPTQVQLRRRVYVKLAWQY